MYESVAAPERHYDPFSLKRLRYEFKGSTYCNRMVSNEPTIAVSPIRVDGAHTSLSAPSVTSPHLPMFEVCV